jgi:hypothetical protein
MTAGGVRQSIAPASRHLDEPRRGEISNGYVMCEWKDDPRLAFPSASESRVTGLNSRSRANGVRAASPGGLFGRVRIVESTLFGPDRPGRRRAMTLTREAEAYVQEVVARLPRWFPARDRIEADLRNPLPSFWRRIDRQPQRSSGWGRRSVSQPRCWPRCR